MSADSDRIQPDALAALLKEQLDKRRSGTLFIKTDENHWGCFGLRDGAIVAVMCRGVKGARALKHIQAASSFSVRFDDSQVTGESAEPPDVSDTDVFAALVPETSAPEAPNVTASGADAGAMPAESAERVAAIIKAEAAEVLGPIGPVICDELLAARPGLSAEDIQFILGQLARDIGNSEEARAFQLRVLERLRGDAG